MPHVVIKGNIDGTESKVFGMSFKEFNDCQNLLHVYGGRVGQDGHTFLNPPLDVLNLFEQRYGYRIVTSSGQGPQSCPIWTLHRSRF